MITTGGKLHIKRYLAGVVPAVAQSIAYGTGGKALAVGDTRLQFEIGRADITLVEPDYVNNKIIYKATIPEDISGVIYELGLFSVAADAVAGEFSSRLLASFDSDTEDWADAGGIAPTYVTTNARVGKDSMRHTPAASGTELDILAVDLDLSGYSNADIITFAFNVGNANTSGITLRFMTSTGNHFAYSYGAQTAGYKFVELPRGSFTSTGTPDWSTITSIQVQTNSGAGGASQVDFEGIRIEDADTINPEYVMVSRDLLSVPFVKEEGKIQEVEFSLGINV